MHEDTKDIYFVYSDTVHKQNAYVKMPFNKIYLEIPPVMEPEIDVRYIFDPISDVEDFREKFTEERAIQEPYKWVWVNFSKEMKAEEFVNILIEFERLNILDKVSKNLYIY